MQACKTAAYGGGSVVFTSSNAFMEARRWVNGSISAGAKIRDVTRAGSTGNQCGGPRTWEIYTDP